MDIASIIGVILGTGLIVGAILMKTSIMTFVDPASVAIVLGGSFAALLISMPLSYVLKVFAVTKKIFFAAPTDPVGHVKKLVHLVTGKSTTPNNV